MIARYTRPVMAALFSDQKRFDTWLAVELTALEAMEKHGVAPAGSAERIAARAVGKLNPSKILEIEERTRHDVIAFLTHVEELAGEDARWLHLGMTSSDVLDTALALILGEASDILLAGVDQLCRILARRANEHRHTAMIGRSHGIHAEPVTVGLVFAGFYAEMQRNRARLVAAQKTIRCGKIAGAVGTYANISPAIEKDSFAKLGLSAETVATQVVARDRHAELLAALALTAASIERIAITVRHWQRTEVGEAEESFGKGQKGSSAMPHKKNPIASENLTGLARLIRNYAGAAYEDVALWHERDISHSSVERMILPDAIALTDFMLQRSASLIDGLVVHADRMRRNLELTGGLIFSEAVMLKLIETGLARQRAYELVQRSALAARDQGKDFRTLLKADPEVGGKLGASLDACFDLQHHLRHVDHIFARVFP